jgi:hypothetical protein
MRRAVGRLGHTARDAPGVAVLVEVAHEGAVGEVELLFLAQPSAEFRNSLFSGVSAIIFGNQSRPVRRHLPKKPGPRSHGQRGDEAHFILCGTCVLGFARSASNRMLRTPH